MVRLVLRHRRRGRMMVRRIPNVRDWALRRPVLVVRTRRKGGGGGRRWGLWLEVVDEGKDLWLAVLGAWA